MSVYYIANDDFKRQWIAYSKRAGKRWDKVADLADEVGAEKEFAYNQVTHRLFGLKFSEPPDPKIWKKLKNCSGYYCPRLNTKVGKAMDERFEEFRPSLVNDLFKYCGYKKTPIWHKKEMQLSHYPSVQKLKKKLVVGFPDWIYESKDFELPKGFVELKLSEYVALGGKV